MKKGDVSAEPVKTDFGWHVIKLEDIRPAKLPPLDSLKPQLKRMIAQQKMMEYMEKMKETADIKVMLPEANAPAADAAADTTEAEKTE